MKYTILNLCAVVMGLGAVLFHLIGFAAPHWLESFEQAHSRFDRLGLWTACFNNFGYDRDALGKMYDGCHWIYSYEYKPIFAWLVPNWFLAVQVMMTLGLIINGGMALMLLTGQAGFFMDKEDFFAQAFKAGGFWTSFLLTCLSVALFGIKSDIDRQWFPRPDQNYLSWSFAFVVIAGFFEIFAAMCLTFDALRIKDVEARRLKKQDPGYMGYKMGPVVTHPQYD
ncbi:uncharacterized protein LOC128205034 [Mya arenaria]|uniref:uncharacterized protein LOC128205034 n=1 Tax=Mya arenaria TaxID=6604 RepID=UPI0022E835B5|nr:uncharacterized protein LOC128205034 [Mya arenaria]XP_052762391.1 uncharacterized protein LOC128205034 [Mya arenaria]XP_052762392.1 uncharacterized protein LOC128205034 [Mya arenaria]